MSEERREERKNRGRERRLLRMRGGRKQGSRGEMNGGDGDADGRGGKGEGKGDEMWRCKVGLGLG